MKILLIKVSSLTFNSVELTDLLFSISLAVLSKILSNCSAFGLVELLLILFVRSKLLSTLLQLLLLT